MKTTTNTRSFNAWIGASTLSLACSLAGCSATIFENDPCTSNRDCQSALGSGSACGDAGFCEEVEFPERCSRTYPADLFTGDDYNDAIIIGSMMDFSLTTQVGRANAIELAAIGANDFDGLEGRSFGIVFCDVQKDENGQSERYNDGLSQADAARAGARFLAEQLQVPAIVGPSASVDTINTFSEIISNTTTLQITPSGTSSSLSGLEAGPFTDASPGRLWRTTPPDTILGSAKARDLNERGVQKVAIVGVEGYGSTLGQTIQDSVVALGGELPSLDTYQDGNDTQRQQLIIEAPENHADASDFVFVSSNTQDMIAFMQIAATSSGYEGKNVLLAVAAANSDFINAAPADFFGNKAEDPENDEPVYQFRTVRYASPEGAVYNNFLSLYSGSFAGEDASGFSFTAQAYDAAWMVLYGAAWSLYRDGDVTGPGIAKGMRQLSSGKEVDVGPSSWLEVRTAFEAGQSVNIQGASGDLDYDPTTEETVGPVEVLVVLPDEEAGEGWTFSVSQRFEPT